MCGYIRRGSSSLSYNRQGVLWVGRGTVSEEGVGTSGNRTKEPGI